MTKIEVFSSPGCDYCRLAKDLLERKGVPYTDLDLAADPKNRQELLRRLPRIKAIPQIFVDGEHIGGYEDLCLLADQGLLQKFAKPARP